MIYLDNAATSFPKPKPCFREALEEYLALGASPGRGGYDASLEAMARVESVRKNLASFFGAEDFVTCFGYNATDALNGLIQGLARPGGHVVGTRLEHNSVLRPLHELERAGVCSFDLVPFNSDGFVEPGAVAEAIGPDTCLVVLNHASNVLGTVQPAAEIGALCREKGIPFILDASQSAGAVPIRMQEWGVSGLAFTGHKSLLGPTGIGGMVVDPQLDVRPTRYGGTGLESANLFQVRDYPERLEAGTINTLGILTLGNCLAYLQSAESVKAHQNLAELHRRLVLGLAEIPGLTLHCPGYGPGRIPVISCNLDGWIPNDAGAVLDGDFKIAVRTGLHCAPLVHQSLGNGQAGSIRISLGPFNTASEVEAVIDALARMARSA